MPTPKRKGSRQDYRTPGEFILALCNVFDAPNMDMAADDNNICGDGYWLGPGSEHPDSLLLDWDEMPAIQGVAYGWLNPPFSNMAPWAKKCSEMGKGRVIMLTPCSLGAEWYRKYVQPTALTLVLNPRLTFVGEKTPYPKDCMISLFGFGMVGLGTWRWK